jgi:hypothetical protein
MADDADELPFFIENQRSSKTVVVPPPAFG